MNILVIIPARGGSKGIPRKNVRLLNEKPLISYAIENAQKCKGITNIVVTTDDEEIEAISKCFNVEVVNRDLKLSNDEITLDPVIFDAVKKTEEKKKEKIDIVITLQPTSPLLTEKTLEKAIDYFVNSDFDTLISATNHPHLSWSRNEEGYFPIYKERLNRQKLPENLIEAGAFFITKREFVKPQSRIGDEVGIYEIPQEESIDIDTIDDWIICEQKLKRKRIVLRADGYKKLGMGHIYHCLTLAFNLTEHEILLVTKESCLEGLVKIKDTHLPYQTIRNDEDFFKFLNSYHPDIVVNDCLDTKGEYMHKLKSLVPRVITIEDLGEGNQLADATINALYQEEEQKLNVYSGEKYICLRDEFLWKKAGIFSEEVRNVLVLFGGTDPLNLTKKIYELVLEYQKRNAKIQFNFVAGLGYDCKLNGIVSNKAKNIKVFQNTKCLGEIMKKADLAFTSQGRTIFELAVMGVPAIVLAQNEREQLHKFAQMENGFLNLGLGNHVTSDTLTKTFDWLVQTPQIRSEMRELMLKKDLKKGIERVKKIILGEDYEQHYFK